jgi:hypothetical protein
VEVGDRNLFLTPQAARTSDYITGRFG